MKVTIYWDARHLPREKALEAKNKIKAKFNIPDYTSINGETPCEIKDEDLPLLRECEKRGFIQIRNK